MKHFFTKKTVTAALFVTILFVMSLLNIQTVFPSLQKDVSDYQASSTSEKPQTFSNLVTNLNNTASTEVFGKYGFIETYGYLQKLMDKKETNNFEVVKAEDGSLHYTYFTTGPNDVQTLAERMERLKNDAESVGSNVMYVMTPDKYIEGVTRFEKGIPYNYANETADLFLDQMRSRQIDTLDFREVMKENGTYTQDSFYQTDHHWKVQTAFNAFKSFADVVDEKYNFQFPNKAYYTDINNYNQIIYKNSYLGSMGRKEGILYSGAEDFDFIYPKFDTNYFFYAQGNNDAITANGRFEQSVCFTSMLSGGDIYDAECDKYFTYMDGNPGFAEITNFDHPDGKKVLFIKDSLMVPVASFFSLGCSKVYMIDPRYYGGNIQDVIDQYHFDDIFVSFSPQNLTTDFFTFYSDDGLQAAH